MISARITEHQLQQAVAGGVVLTGSGAMLGGVDLLFSKAMESPARVAGAGDLYGLTDRLSRPDALGAVGMLDWMLDSSDVIQPNRNRAASRSPDSAGSMLSSIASGVAGLARVFSPNS